MRLFISSIFVCCSIFANAQKFADAEFYLVDSLELNSISPKDRIYIDSLLTQFHAQESDIDKTYTLRDLTNGIVDDHTWPKYNEVLLDFTWNRMFSNSLNEEDRLVLIDGYSSSLNNIGFYAQNIGDYKTALHYNFQSLRIEQQTKDPEGQMSSYLNIGGIYYHLKDYDKAKSYFLKADSISTDSTSAKARSLITNNLAVVHVNLQDYESAVHYHLKSIEIATENNNDYGLAMSYNNLGGLYTENFEDSLQAGITYLEKARQIFLDLERYAWLSMTYDKLARAYIITEDYGQAEINANFGLFYAQKTTQSEPSYRIYRTLYRVKKKLGNDKEALFYYEKYQKIDDSLQASEVISDAKVKEIQFQLEQEQILIDLENDKELALANATQKRQKVTLIALVAVVVLILLFAIIQVQRNRKIKEQKGLLESQNEERAVLIKEVHHRVKNNFQIICSVLRLQAGDENNERVSQVFEDAINRITSMSQVHDMVYRSEKFVEVDTHEYFTRLSETHSYSAQGTKIDYKIDSEVENLSMDTIISLGLIVNELITNSVKHGFNQNGDTPAIDIGLKTEADEIAFYYADNGTGFDQKELKGSFGMELIQTMSDHLQGESSFDSEKGMSFGLKFGLA